MNILLINHNQSFDAAVKSSLKGAKMKILVSSSFDNAAFDVQKYNAQIVLINWSKADFDLAALCKKLRKIKLSKYLYIMAVATRDKEQHLNGFIEAGMNDYLFKPFGKDELRSRIAIAEEAIKLQEELNRYKKKIIKLVKEDPTTGLYNRRALLDEVLKEMGRASREMTFISAVMMSITNYDEVLDQNGIAIMDEVLEECGRRMKTSCRPYDKIGRYDASDFLLFLPDSDKNKAEKVARRVLSSLVKKPIYIKGNKIQLLVSMGLAELNPSEISKSNKVDSYLVNDLILDAIIKKTGIAIKKAISLGDSRIEIFREF